MSFILKALTISFLFLLVGCSTLDRVIHPDEKSNPPTWPTFEQVLKENYKGPKARVVVNMSIDKSAKHKETTQVIEGMAEMLRNAMLATNRYIVQVRKSSDGAFRRQDISDSGQIKKEEETDLFVEGMIKEFKYDRVEGGEGKIGTSYVTLITSVIDPSTRQTLATEKIRGKAIEFGESTGKDVGGLPEVFKDYSRTPMENAIRIVIEDSASFIVAKTPPESYRVSPVSPSKETPKPPPAPVKVQPEVAPPSQPAPIIPTSPTPPPPLRVTQVIWDHVNLREGPGMNHKVIGKVRKGTSLKILEVKGDWLHVRLENGSEAWIIKLATSEAPKPPPSTTTPSLKPTPM